MPLFKSKEERATIKAEKKRLRIEKWDKKVAEADAQLSQNKAQRDAQLAQNKAQRDAQLAQNKAQRDARNAKYDAEIAEIRSERAEIRAHNKRVLSEWANEVGDIKRDLIEENRQISQHNRDRRNR